MANFHYGLPIVDDEPAMRRELKFGFVKVRYRGLKKNANRLFATCALVNLFVARNQLLRLAPLISQYSSQLSR